MAKKKSKTQKYKKNQKQKVKKQQTTTQAKKTTTKPTSTKSNTTVTKAASEKKIATKKTTSQVPSKTTPPKTAKTNNKKTSVITAKELPKIKKTTNKINIKEKASKIFFNLKSKLNKAITKTKKTTPQENKLKSLFLQLKSEEQIKKEQKNKKQIIAKKNKEIAKDLPKLATQTKEAPKTKNVFLRLLFELKNNIHIIFNAILIIIFLIMLIGFIRIRVLEKGTILYICAIVGFLMLVAMSYNKYISGKVFTIVLSIGMIAVIYHMQYTYDFIRNLNSNLYEYKTYYVVTFDNNSNRSIYNINNKKVGLLKDNCINIERMLNTKLDKVNYLEYENINELFADFYNQEFRAILVNENQYKYLKNNIEENSRAVKILYEFQANAKK